jgi:hypothetical protein
MVFNAMGHYKLAVELCNRALKIEPRLATAVCHKAHATLGNKKYFGGKIYEKDSEILKELRGRYRDLLS